MRFRPGAFFILAIPVSGQRGPLCEFRSRIAECSYGEAGVRYFIEPKPVSWRIVGSDSVAVRTFEWNFKADTDRLHSVELRQAGISVI